MAHQEETGSSLVLVPKIQTKKKDEFVSFAVPVQAVIRAQQDWLAVLPSLVIKTRPPSICLELRGTQTRVYKGNEERGLA